MSANEEIVSAINDLTDEIKGLKEEIANMRIRDLTHAIDMLATKLEDFGNDPKRRCGILAYSELHKRISIAARLWTQKRYGKKHNYPAKRKTWY